MLGGRRAAMGVGRRCPVGGGGLRRRLVGPVAVLAVEVARRVLGVALALTRDPDAEDDVQHPHRDAGGDDRHTALDAAQAASGRDDRDQTARHDRDREPDPDEAHQAASGAAARTPGEKRSTSSAAVTGSPGSARPTVNARYARTSSASSPMAARSASVTAPWRLASRVPSGPSMSGTWAWRGAAPPRRPPRPSLRGGEGSRTHPPP